MLAKCKKSESLTILEQLTFKFRGSREHGHAPFFEKKQVVSGLSLGIYLSNLKSVSLTVLEILAFNARNA